LGHPLPTPLTSSSFSGMFRNGILKTPTISFVHPFASNKAERKGSTWVKLGIIELHYNLGHSDFGSI
jgi:hypothetical protein